MGRKPRSLKPPAHQPPAHRPPAPGRPRTVMTPPPTLVPPASATAAARATPSPASPAPLPGGPAITRRVLFQAPTQRDGWWLDMVTAISAAQRLGVTGFEIALQGEHERSALSARDREVMAANNAFHAGGFSLNLGGSAPAAATVTVYALVVE